VGAAQAGRRIGRTKLREGREPLAAQRARLGGIGAEGGEEGIREFLETRVISMPKPGVDG
jgi:hypothetical protein